jgi:hypothetical protein
MKLASMLAVCAGCLVPASAHAGYDPNVGAEAPEPDEVSGFEFGARVGYTTPGGKIGGLSSSSRGFATTQDTAMSDVVGGGFDYVFDVGHRVNRTIYYGLQVAYAPSLGTPGCDSGCTTNGFRVGLALMVHPRVHSLSQQIDPYLSFGVNYDQLSFGASGTSETIKFYGMEFMNLQLGSDYLVTPQLSVGAFFSTSFGMYFGADHAKTDNVALHEWFTFGIRGAYRL